MVRSPNARWSGVPVSPRALFWLLAVILAIKDRDPKKAIILGLKAVVQEFLKTKSPKCIEFLEELDKAGTLIDLEKEIKGYCFAAKEMFGLLSEVDEASKDLGVSSEKFPILKDIENVLVSFPSAPVSILD